MVNIWGCYSEGITFFSGKDIDFVIFLPVEELLSVFFRDLKYAHRVEFIENSRNIISSLIDYLTI